MRLNILLHLEYKSNNTNCIALVCSYNKNIKSDPVNYGIIIKE